MPFRGRNGVSREESGARTYSGILRVVVDPVDGVSLSLPEKGTIFWLTVRRSAAVPRGA